MLLCSGMVLKHQQLNTCAANPTSEDHTIFLGLASLVLNKNVVRALFLSVFFRVTLQLGLLAIKKPSPFPNSN